MFIRTRIIKRFALLSFIVSLLILLLLIAFFRPVLAQAEYIYDEDVYTLPACNCLTTTTPNHYNNSAIYSTSLVSLITATYAMTLLPPWTDFTLYAWRPSGAIYPTDAYGAMRFILNNQYLDTIDMSGGTGGWQLVGDFATGAADEDAPYLTVDRADPSSGYFVLDAIRLVALSATAESLITSTVIYTLPTTGDTVLYHREVGAGEIMIAAPIYGLIIIGLFRLIWRTATGGG